MDAELIGAVNDAAWIESSGRWKVLNQRIVRCAANINGKKRWHFALFCSIWYEACSEYLSIKGTYYSPSDNDLSLVAWRGRNLLELRIWAAYFCRSEQNAKRIYEDSGRDGLDIFKTVATWGKVADQEIDWETKLKQADEMLRERAKEAGIDDLDGTYKAVRDAAQECGLDRDYRLQFKVFSKFAHPTAFQLITPADDPTREPFRDAFFSQGCGLFALTFACLESYLDRNSTWWEKSNLDD